MIDAREGSVESRSRRSTPGLHARVLLVDDDHDLRQVIAAGLEMLDFEVYAAASYDEALAVAHSWTPDVIVLDLMGTGHRWSATTGLGIPTVLASGSSRDYLDALAGHDGTVALLPKPYDLNQLVRVLETLLAVPA